MANYVESLELDRHKGKRFLVSCPNCSVDTWHEVLSSAEIDGATSDQMVYWSSSHQIVQCKGCEGVSFRKSTSNSEDTWLDNNGEWHQDVAVRLYPPRIAGSKVPNGFHRLPTDVSRIYEETRSAMCNDQPVLAGIGIRALIETVCKEKEANGDNLAAKIDALVVDNVLTTDSATILHTLRILGNQSAHEVDPHSPNKLRIALQIVETLLANVYILPLLAQQLDESSSTGQSPPF